jgi:hypothetical protein
MEKNNLTLIFPDSEEKIAFMRWFKEKGFDMYLKDSKSFIECISDYEEGLNDESDFFDFNQSYIELQ